MSFRVRIAVGSAAAVALAVVLASILVYVVARELFTTRSGSIRVVTDGVGEGKTIQRPDGMVFGKSVWDDAPSQLVCVDVDAPKLMALVEKTLVRR